MSDSSLPSARLVWLTFSVAVVFSVISGVIFALSDPDLHLDLKNFAVFAPIYAAAQAIERLLEPIAARYKPADAEKKAVKEAKEEKLAATTNQERSAAETTEQAAEAALRKRRSERALIYFIPASVLSLLLTGALGLGILQAMATKPLEECLGAIDVALTGLVIAAGTKPLHDLVARLEKAKENADPATKPTTPAPPVTPPPTP